MSEKYEVDKVTLERYLTDFVNDLSMNKPHGRVKWNEGGVTVAVTGLNNIDSPGPGIPVIRGIRESKDFDVRIIGLAYEHLEPGIYMRDLVDKTYMIPLPG